MDEVTATICVEAPETDRAAAAIVSVMLEVVLGLTRRIWMAAALIYAPGDG